ncbi:hypothetical protein NM688_g2708 [Phlebia brevispora]|uniref:Uncharacterized protein n=1 Tax=Phlebia brevispora TaxID=194682 RepID=A0ACC1T817_9APHY|nr:hypothetical protein NM688_g2708 [Phlebia brevispora]
MVAPVSPSRYRQIPLHVFAAHVLPPLLHDTNCAETVAVLKTMGSSPSRHPITKKSRWRGFAKDPAKTRDTPETSFSYLQDAVEASMSASGFQDRGTVPLLKFRHNPKCIMTLEAREADSLPDAYFVTSQEGSWETIAVCGEFKKRDTQQDIKDNAAKLTWSMSNCLRRDPRRRFVFGFTIENTSMRLWYGDRSGVAASEPFNFITDHEHVVHFSLSVLYAQPHQLGWDPTMVPLPDGLNYDITIYPDAGPPRVYRTLSLLSDSGAREIRGRATRVWKAALLEEGEVVGEPVVLKDCWVEGNRTCEGTAIELIRNAIRPTVRRSSHLNSLLDDVFLTVRHHEYVFLDDTRETMDCTRRFEMDDVPSQESVAARSGALRDTQHAAREVHGHGFAPRKHYRIVFAEVCQPLQDETSLSKVFKALAVTACALEMMHCGGWVHRDVSAGNILLCDNVHGAKLADLEYARKMNERDNDDEFRAGTEHFRAMEVETQTYQLLSSPTPPPSPPTHMTACDMLQLPSPTRLPSPPPPPKKMYLFRYNPLHDLESLWWVAAYFLFKKVPYLEDGVVPDLTETPPAKWDAEGQYLCAEKLFRATLARWEVVTLAGGFFERIQVLHPLVKPIAELLDPLRLQLIQYYAKAERNLEAIDQNCAKGLHKDFVRTFLLISRHFKNIKIRPFILTPISDDAAQYGENVGVTQDEPSAHRLSRTKRTADWHADDHEELDGQRQRKRRQHQSANALRPNSLESIFKYEQLQAYWKPMAVATAIHPLLFPPPDLRPRQSTLYLTKSFSRILNMLCRPKSLVSAAQHQQVPLHVFFRCALPPLLHGTNCAAVVDVLRHMGSCPSQRPITKRSRWRGFAKDPAKTKDPPETSFDYLQDVVQAIIQAGGLGDRGIESTLQFRHNPTCNMSFGKRGADSLPDSFLSISSEASWEYIAVCGEYKKGDTEEDVKDNVARLTWSMSNCLRRDPRRRFVFGYTIENTSMRLWLGDRSGIVASENFNFITDHEQVVHFFLSVLYAQPHQLGWDPTMVLLPDGRNYDITVHSDAEPPRVYRTLSLLSDSGALEMDARGTRVWKAVLVEDGKVVGEPVVLKDCWVDANRTCEGTVVDLIRAATRTSEHAAEWDRLLHDAFLTVRHHGYVFLDGERNSMDCTLHLSLGDDRAQEQSAEHPKAGSTHGRSTVAKRHYRIVFAEVCQPLQWETSLARVFRALAATASVLEMMHYTGWIHRDISTGNILLCDTIIGTRLADLEYARKMNEEGNDDEFCCGTDFFRAFEVEIQNYEYIPDPTPPPSTMLPDPESIWEYIQRSTPTEPPSPPRESKPGPAFRYNPLHDLESLWWIALYFLFKKEPYLENIPALTEPIPDPKWDRIAQCLCAERLFHIPSARWEILMGAIGFSTKKELLHPLVKPIAELLNVLRLHLLKCYRDLEKDADSIDHNCAKGLHRIFMRTFFSIAKRAANIKVRPLTLTAIKETASDPVHTPVVAGSAKSGEHSKAVQDKLSMHQVSNTKRTAAQLEGHVPLDGIPPRKRPRTGKIAAARIPTHRYNLRPRRKALCHLCHPSALSQQSIYSLLYLRLLMVPIPQAFQQRQIPLHVFFRYALPPLLGGMDCVVVVDALRHMGPCPSQRPITKKSRWRGFAEDPAKTKDPPETSFDYLRDTVKAIIKASGLRDRDLEPTLCFQHNSTCKMRFEDREADSLPDSFLAISPEVSWKNIAVCGEYKKGGTDEDVKDNIMKLTWSMSNCLRCDPRRRFVIAYTIENTHMKLWYGDRSGVVASESFNFITDHEHVVHFFLSVLYAQPHQLGWDPTMVPLPDGCNYDITVRADAGPPQVYRTLSLLSDSGALEVNSRGTRVWKAVLVEDGRVVGSPVALKDCWADANRTCEGTVIDLVRTAVSTSTRATEWSRLLHEAFLTVRHHGYVFLDDARESMDCTLLFPPDDDPVGQPTKHAETGCSHERSTVAKNHYRIVFAEVCQPLRGETSLAKVFKTLASTAYVLEMMHYTGWIHRDISTGNILLCDNAIGTRLADLEYARKMNAEGTEDEFCCGTDYFRAFEVEIQNYEYIRGPTPPPSSSLGKFDMKSIWEYIQRSTSTEPPSPPRESKPRPAFRYSPLHDLESLWWIALYFLFKKEPYLENVSDFTEPLSDPQWDRTAQYVCAEQLFRVPMARWEVLMGPIGFETKQELLHPLVKPIAELLNVLRLRLLGRYWGLEKDANSIDHKCAEGLHRIFVRIFLSIAKQAANIKVRPLALAAVNTASDPVPIYAVAGSAKNAEDSKGVQDQSPTHRFSDAKRTAAQLEEHAPLDGIRARKRPRTGKGATARIPTHRYNLRPRRKVL